MPRVSIIVPVYNAEKYLRRCVDSILSQTFRDFELLLINDGSTDSSAVICDEYGMVDNRVRVFHKENGGVSSARNLGLDNVLGEWVTFVDSDDWIALRYLETLCSHTIKGVDLIISYPKCFTMQGEIRQKKYLERCVDAGSIETLFLDNDLNWQTAPWAKLYNQKLCHNLRFIVGMNIGEDMVFLYSYIMKCNKIYVSSSDNYNYDMTNQHTLTRQIGTYQAEYFAYSNVYKIIGEIIKYYRIETIDVLNKLNWIKAYYIGRVLNSLYKSPYLSRESRLNCLLKMDINLYLSFYESRTIKEKLLYSLLNHRQYFTYDFIRILYSKIRS